MSDITRLFSEDPLNHTRDDITAIVDHFRKARAAFNLGDKTAGKAPKAAKKTTVDINLDGLLDLEVKK